MNNNSKFYFYNYVNEIREPICESIKKLQKRLINKYIELEKDNYSLSNNKHSLKNFQIEYLSVLVNTIKTLQEQEPKSCQMLLQLLYHDTLMLLNCTDKSPSSTNNLYEKLKTNIRTPQEIIALYKTDERHLLNLVNGFLYYNDLDYFAKRKIYLKTTSEDKYLSTIFPSHIIDKIYYTKPYTVNNITGILSRGASFQPPNIVIENIQVAVFLLLNLFNSDIDNYIDIMLPLLNNYYKNKMAGPAGLFMKNNLSKELINMIENWEITDVLYYVAYNHTFLKDIVLEFYKDQFIYDQPYKQLLDQNYSAKRFNKVRSKFKKS